MANPDETRTTTRGTPYKVKSSCRLCGGPLELVIDLGSTPLANELFDTPAASRNQERFPLRLSECEACGHVQCPVVVPPERLFAGDYPYVSGTSPAFVEHLRGLAAKLVRERFLEPGALVVEVGSNDGTLLLELLRAAPLRVVGVDPASKLAELANARGALTIADFFTGAVANKIREEHGQAEVVVANNVFAHAEDLGAIVDAARSLLAPGGAFVFEVGYLRDMLETGAFDLAYHEHLSFHHVRPIELFLARRGMKVAAVERIAPQGGSIRVTAVHAGSPEPSHSFEEPLVLPTQNLGRKVADLRERLVGVLRKAREDGKRVAGYGAPAKLATLASVLGLTERDVAFVAEDNPLKHGKHVPGTGIPILPRSALYDAAPDLVVIFGWNFAESIRAMNPGATWTWCEPLPELRFVSGGAAEERRAW